MNLDKKYGLPQSGRGPRRRGTGPHVMSEGDSVPVSLRIPGEMAREIDGLISKPGSNYLSRAEVIRAAIERYLVAQKGKPPAT